MSGEGAKRYAGRIGELIGYARCSTILQDLTAQREILAGFGVPEDRMYLDKGLTGTSRAWVLYRDGRYAEPVAEHLDAAMERVERGHDEAREPAAR